MLSIILFILLLTFLITIHELGHFLVALWCKVGVLEFGFGLPPRVKTLFTYKGVPFTLNAIPLGGFVRMDGEDRVEDAIADSKQTTANSKIKNTVFPFYARPLWQKLAIVFAGPLVNIIFGIIIFSSLYAWLGIPKEVSIPPTITQIAENSPAAKAGIRAGDEILMISPKVGGEQKSVSTVKEVISMVNANRGAILAFTLKRDGGEQVIPVYARKIDEIPAGEGTIGVALSDVKSIPTFYPLPEQLYRGSILGITKSFEFSKMILTALRDMGTSVFAGKIPSEVSGPVGIASQVTKQQIFQSGFATAFNFAALLSINLGVMNLLPIPALDGGRIVLLIIERLLGKHGRQRFQTISANLNQFGFFFLIGILALITIKDLIGLLR